MVELITEILIYLGLAALLGLVLGYLIWGWGKSARISAARAEGAAGARTSLDGNVGLREQLEACGEERARLEEEVESLTAELARERARGDDLERAMLEAQESPSAPEEPSHEPADERLDDEGPFEDTAEDAAGDAATAEDATAEDTTGDDEPAEPVEASEATEAPLETEATDTTEETPTEPVASAEPESDDASPPVPTGLLSERPDEVDDLKRIKGVGTVMEGVLNDKGLYLFRQVANLTEREVDWVNDAIAAFPGRIRRDRWVEQAKQLYHDKYGKAHDAPD